VVVKTEEVKVEEWRTRLWGLGWGRGKREEEEEEEEEGKKKKKNKKKRWHPKILIWLQGRRVKEVARAAVPALPRSDRSGSRSRSGMQLPFGRGVCTFCFFSLLNSMGVREEGFWFCAFKNSYRFFLPRDST
jgi:hypothetical protein